jgi:hypothetical protein
MVSDVELGKKLETMSVPPDLHQMLLLPLGHGQIQKWTADHDECSEH